MDPKKIGRYEILDLIGKGGMAAVYRARDPNFKRDVALKVLPPKFLSDPTFRSRFDREAHTIAQLEHPTIVPVYDYGEDQEQPYIVMRLMTGRSLADRLGTGPIPIDQIVHILRRLADGLDFAHQKGVIHRDLKPGNILFDHSGNPYLSDFGIAKLAGSSSNLTDGAIIGTPAYISPEQGLGGVEIDWRSDLYALGVILFEMLTGRLPFEADAATDQILKHISQPVPNILNYNPGLPQKIQAVIERAMDKNPTARFPTANELVNALAEAGGLPASEIRPTTNVLIDSGTPSKSRLTPTPTPGHVIVSRHTPAGSSQSKPISQPLRKDLLQPTKPQKVNKSNLGIIVGLFIAAALLILGVVFWPQISQTFDLSQQQIPTIPSPEKVADELSKLAGTLIPLPSSTLEAPTSTPNAAATIAITLTPEVIATEIHSTPTLEFAAVPERLELGNADRLAFLKENAIYAVNLDGSDLELVWDRGGEKTNLQWTPDGQSITYISGKCLEIINTKTKRQENIFCANWVDALYAFEISPDGQFVALSLSDGLFILPYDLVYLSQIARPEQLSTSLTCAVYKENTVKSVRWARDGSGIAAVVVTSDAFGRNLEVVRLLQLNGCGEELGFVIEIPGDHFEINEYDLKPFISSFGWDGERILALNINRLNNFGQVYQYNLGGKATELYLLGEDAELGTRCCFRDYRWSPDGQYLLFTFQDYNIGKGIEIYYVKFGTLNTGEKYSPIPLPADFLSSISDQKLEPVLRAVKQP